MLSYFECRRRIRGGELYAVRSWYLLGFILVFRRYEQLTTGLMHSMPSERL